MKWIVISIAIVITIFLIPNTEYYVKVPEVINPFTVAKAEFDRTGLVSTSTARLAIHYVFGPMGATFEAIAVCESGLMHYKEPGVLNRNLVTPDTGLFQISSDYHSSTMKKLGFKPYSIEDNIRFAKYLYDKNGLSDWRWSKHCWNAKIK